MWFDDRRDAGRRLAGVLGDVAAQDPLVLALPRGGVPIGYEVAHALGAPLDVLAVRKMSAPLQPELGVGAIAEGGATYIDEDGCELLGIFEEDMEQIAAREQAEVERWAERLRQGRIARRVRDRTAILVDDGVESGATVRAAIAAVRRLRPAKLILALPIAPAAMIEELRPLVDELVCLQAPIRLLGIGMWYRDFPPVTEDEVVAVLAQARAERPDLGTDVVSDGRAMIEDLMHVAAGGVYLEGDLTVPACAGGLVLIAHAGGGSRHAARIRVVTRALQQAGLATLLLDLFTARERKTDAALVRLRFEIELLAERIVAALDRLRHDGRTAHLGVSCFGASTAAAAVLMAAGERPEQVRSVVSYSGRPDLAGVALGMVRAPTLLIVGGEDPVVLDLNRRALAELHVEKRLAIVPGATHLFDEPGALERVAELARRWVELHLQAAPGVVDVHSEPAAAQ